MDEELIKAEHELHSSQGLPQGVKLASYSNRRELNTAMEKLEANGFPMQTLFVVSTGMRQVDFYMGKLSYPRIALSAAISGLLFGLFFAALIGLATGGSMLAAAVSYVPIAIAFTVIYSVFNFSRQRKQSNGGYMMRSVAVPEALELHCLPISAQQGQEILGVQRSAPQKPRTPEFFLPSQPAVRRPESSEAASPAATRAENSTDTPDAAPNPRPRQQGPAAQNFGRLVEDPEEFAQAIRQEPERPNTNERIEQIRAEQSSGRYGLRIESQEEFEKAIRKPEDQEK